MREITSDETMLVLLADFKANIRERDRLVRMMNFRIKHKNDQAALTEAEWKEVLPHCAWAWTCVHSLYTFSTHAFGMLARTMKRTVWSIVQRMLEDNLDTNTDAVSKER